MKIRRNSLWFIKVSIFIIIIFGSLYLIVRQAYHDSKESPNSVDEKIKAEDHLTNAEPLPNSIVLKQDAFKVEKPKPNVIKVVEEGPGERGLAYHLPSGFEKEKDHLYRQNGFNARASDDIALNRSIPDIRHPKCKEIVYDVKLPSTSVIIPFYNEHWSTLLRTFISVLNRSPPQTLLEIILVDDGSDKEFLKSKLDAYVASFPKVQVLHLAKRAGLIRARLAGAKKAKGEAIVFLDSHTECNVDWLPPLLAPIARDSRTCVCPYIDVIDFEDFSYRQQDEGARGAFDWELFYKRLPLLQKDKDNLPQPFKSPVMAGGLFAIGAAFFWELGGYDPGLNIWGGEQYELSFKIWQCGGTMLDAPCSRVGHVYRKFAPFSNPGGGNYLGRNYKRVAEVWMDEYAEYVYKRRPYYRRLDAGDLTAQKDIRRRLSCKSFKWFMTEVAFDLAKVYPPVEPQDFANGTIRSVAFPSLCVDTEFKHHQERFGLRMCGSGAEQSFRLTWHRDIRPGQRALCWDVASGDTQAPVLLYNCHGGMGNQLWKYDRVNQQLVHGVVPRCLDSNPGNKEVFLSPCDSQKTTQRWVFEHFDAARLDNWDKDGVVMED